MLKYKLYIICFIIRLFFGGFHRIKIIGLRLKATKQNFEDFIASLWYFDAMINGGNLEGIKVSKKDVLIIGGLLDKSLKKETKATFDEYIYSTFSSLLQHKKQIILNLHYLYKGTYETMRDLMMYRFKKRDHFKESVREHGDFTNLFRSEIFGIFPNLKTIIIQSTSWEGF